MEQEQQTFREYADGWLKEHLRHDWLPRTRQVLWTILITLVVVVVVLLSVYLLLYIISLLSGKTVWELLRVLAVPIAVGAGVPLLNWLQKRRELEIENQRAQDDALKDYLDQMGKLLLDRSKSSAKSGEGDEVRDEDEVRKEVRTLARAWTLTVLERLDSQRKASVLRFLYEARWIIKGQWVVDLSDADLRGVDLRGAHLPWIDLRSARLNGANLGPPEKVILDKWGNRTGNMEWSTDPDGACLDNSDLSGADLRGAILKRASLKRANLYDAKVYGMISEGADTTDATLPKTLEDEFKNIRM